MRYPKPLKPEKCRNNILGVATSFGIEGEPYETCLHEGVKKLDDAGYHVEVDELVNGNDMEFLATDPMMMGRRFTEAYTSSGNDALFSVAGGELMCEIMDYIDFDKIAKSDPTWFMGFSDNTNLAFILPTLCDVAAIYGPCIPDFAMEPWHQVMHASLRALATPSDKTYVISGYYLHQGEKLRDEEHPLADFNATVPNVLQYVGCDKTAGTSFGGRALGGCLDVLSLYPGTKYDNMEEFNSKYGDDGIVWLLEPCDMNMLDVRRALWQLDHAGWFDQAKGFVFGRAPKAGEPEALSYRDAVESALANHDVPILLDCDLGHIPPSMPFIEGALTEVDAKGDRMKLVQKLV